MVRMLAKNAFMDQLVADGVQYIFGNPGTTELAFMEALPGLPANRVRPGPPGGRSRRHGRRLRPCRPEARVG